MRVKSTIWMKQAALTMALQSRQVLMSDPYPLLDDDLLKAKNKSRIRDNIHTPDGKLLLKKQLVCEHHIYKQDQTLLIETVGNVIELAQRPLATAIYAVYRKAHEDYILFWFVEA